MNFLRQVASRIGLRQLEGMDLQESLDVMKGLELAIPNPDMSYVKKCSLDKQQLMLQPIIISKLGEIISTTNSSINGSRSRAQTVDSNPDSFPLQFDNVSTSKTALLKHIQSQLGFSVQVRESSVKGAGDGVWLNGRAQKGSIVAIYPGIVYSPVDLRSKSILEKLYPDDYHFLYCRYDGVLIDGRSALQTQDNEHLSKTKLFSHPFGVGHMLNHPPKGTSPNVVALACDIPSKQFSKIGGTFPLDLLDCLPNRYHTAPSLLKGTYSPAVMMRTVVMMANRSLEDEELFLDYRFSPKVERPEWYTPVDDVVEKRSWEKQ
jgi:hypothetical protein